MELNMKEKVLVALLDKDTPEFKLGMTPYSISKVAYENEGMLIQDVTDMVGGTYSNISVILKELIVEKYVRTRSPNDNQYKLHILTVKGIELAKVIARKDEL